MDAVHEAIDAAPSTQTPRSAARSRAQVAASYVGTFVAGVCAAAIPLLSLLKQIADHRDDLLAVADLAGRVGWPAFISAIAVGWMHLERRAWRAERAEIRAEMQAERRASRAEVEAIGAEVAGALRENTAVLRELLRRLGRAPGSGDTTGQHSRIGPEERSRRTTGAHEVR